MSCSSDSLPCDCCSPQHLEGLINSFEAHLLSPSYVATEVGTAAAISAAAWGADRCLRLCRLKVMTSLGVTCGVTSTCSNVCMFLGAGGHLALSS